jgi:hypothetical protein
MATQLDDQAQTRLAVAALFVALVRTLGEQDQSVPARFDENLERLYRDMEDYPSNPVGALETLRWTHEMLRKQRQT